MKIQVFPHSFLKSCIYALNEKRLPRMSGALCLVLILLAVPLCAVVPAVTASGSATFPSTAVASTSVPQNLLLQLNVAETVSITVNASQGGAHEYAVGAVTGCTVDGVTSNASGSICTVPLTFRPAYPGERDVPLTVTTSAGVFHFGLSGIGTGPQVAFVPGTISTVPGTALNIPEGVAVDSAGNVYIADALNHEIWKMDANFNLKVVAGNGTPGYTGDGGLATHAQLNQPEGVAVDSAGNIYIAEWINAVIRKVDANTGNISTVAGNGTQGYHGDGGLATLAELSESSGVAVDRAGNIYIADNGNDLIRKVDAATGIINTIAGLGTLDYTHNGVPASQSVIFEPWAVAVDSAGNIFFDEVGNNVIREISATTGNISTVAGNGTAGYSGDGGPATQAGLCNPWRIAVDKLGNVFISDGTSRIRRVDAKSHIITTVAGNGTEGFTGDGGAATAAEISPAGVAVDGNGVLYIEDSGSGRIRMVEPR